MLYSFYLLLGTFKNADMDTIELTTEEKRILKKAKAEMLTDRYATPASNQRNEQKIAKVADKYNVDTQVIWDAIKTGVVLK